MTYMTDRDYLKHGYITAHREYVRGVVPLKIWHVRDQAFRAGNPLSIPELLDRYVDLFRLTALNKGTYYPTYPADFFDPEWDALKRELERIIVKHKDDPDAEATEQQCLEYLWPRLEPAIAAYPPPLRKGPDNPFGCWRYGIRDNDVRIHIANAYQPYSPFDEDHFPLLVQDLHDLLNEAKAKNPAVTTLGCGSWMNRLPAFLKVFCPAWQRNLKFFRDYGTSVAFWGQYVSRTGGFNEKGGAYLRRTGRHRFVPYSGSCGMDEQMAYLRRMLNIE